MTDGAVYSFFAKHGDKAKRAALCAVTLLFVVGLFLVNRISLPRTVYRGLTGGSDSVVGEIARRNTVEQEYPYHSGDCGIAIQFATYGRENLGFIDIHIEGETSGFVYYDEKTPVSAISDNAFRDLVYVEGHPDEDEKLRIEISSTSRTDRAITAWSTAGDALPDYALTVGGKTMDADLVMQTIVTLPGTGIFWPILALVVIAVFLTLITVFGKKLSPEKGYAAVAVMLGLIYTFVMTPMSIPDELTHYYSTYRLSNILCFQWNDIASGDAEYCDFHDISAHANVGSAYGRVMNELLSAAGDVEEAKMPLGGSLEYPIMLLPQAIGFTIGRLLGANFLIAFYLGRITNVLFYIGCIYLAIQKVPRFKLLLAMTGILPMALHQAGSYSYDAFINGMSLLMIALILRAIEAKGPISKKELLGIVITGCLLAPTKAVYAPMALLACLIPAKRFQSKRHYFLSIVAIMVFVAAAIMLFQLHRILGLSVPTSASLNWEGQINYSIRDILHQPLRTAKVFINSIKASTWDWFKQSIGSSFSGLTISVREWTIIAYAALLLMSAFSFEGERVSTALERFVYLAIGIVTFLFVLLAMFVGWTSNTRDLILGVQGRYFIPVLPLFYMSLNNPMVTLRKPLEKHIFVMGVLLNIVIMSQVFFETLLR